MTPGLLKKSFPLSLILLLFAGALNAQILEQSFSEDASGFTITLPNQDWVMEPRSITPGPVRANIRFKTQLNQFTPNVVVRVGLLQEKDISLERFMELEFRDMPPRIEVLKKGKFKHGARTGYRMELLDSKLNLTFYQWIFLKKGKSYILTAAAKTSSLPRVKEGLEKILNSFKLQN